MKNLYIDLHPPLAVRVAKSIIVWSTGDGSGITVSVVFSCEIKPLPILQGCAYVFWTLT